MNIHKSSVKTNRLLLLLAPHAQWDAAGSCDVVDVLVALL